MVKETNQRHLKKTPGWEPTTSEVQDAFFSQTQWLEQFCMQMQNGEYDRVALSLYSYGLYGAVSVEQALRFAAKVPLGQDLNRQHSLLELAERNGMHPDDFFRDHDRLLIWVRYLASRQKFFPDGNLPPMVKWLETFVFSRFPVERDQFLKEVYEGVIAHYQHGLQFVLDNEMRANPSFKRFEASLAKLKSAPLKKFADGQMRAPLASKEAKEMRTLREKIEETLRQHPQVAALPNGNPIQELQQVCINLRLLEQHFEMRHAGGAKGDSRLQSPFAEYESHADKLFEHLYKSWLYLYGFRSEEILSHNLKYLSGLLREVHKISTQNVQLLKKRNPGISHHYRHTCTMLSQDQKNLLRERMMILQLGQDEVLDHRGFAHDDLSKTFSKQMKELLELFQREATALLHEVERKGREMAQPGAAAPEKKA